MKIGEDLYLIEDLFRVGNANGPRLEHVRDRDITIVFREGLPVVLPETGGISLFNKIHPSLRGIWWKCSAWTAYPEGLDIVCDRERQGLRHYIIQPAYVMELSEFQALLREFARSFKRVEPDGE